jgi:TPR repeat protein
MKTNRIIMSAAAALAFATLSTTALASPEAWQRANGEYEVQHYAQALEIYEQLAATGDARAAELAGHMLAMGESLYGDTVQRDPVRATRLLAQAADADRPVAKHLLRQVKVASAAPIRNP